MGLGIEGTRGLNVCLEGAVNDAYPPACGGYNGLNCFHDKSQRLWLTWVLEPAKISGGKQLQ